MKCKEILAAVLSLTMLLASAAGATAGTEADKGRFGSLFYKEVKIADSEISARRLDLAWEFILGRMPKCELHGQRFGWCPYFAVPGTPLSVFCLGHWPEIEWFDRNFDRESGFIEIVYARTLRAGAQAFVVAWNNRNEVRFEGYFGEKGWTTPPDAETEMYCRRLTQAVLDKCTSPDWRLDRHVVDRRKVKQRYLDRLFDPASSLALPNGRRVLKTDITGHRGDCRSLPENTLLAFRHALNNGFSFECDFYMSTDGEVFCSHDMWLKRCFGLSKYATNVCWKGELENVDVGAFKGAAFAGRPDCRVPRIDEVFALVPEDRVVTLEVKDPRPEIVKLIRAAWNRHPHMKEENVIFLAHKATRAALVKEFPRATYQHCVNCYSDGWKKGCSPIPVKKQLEALDARPECRNYSTMHDMDLLTTDYVDAVHARGCAFFTWCVDDPAEAIEVFQRGVDGICTNCPKELWDGMARLLGE